MKYTQELEPLENHVRTVITLGKFDGVHCGHQKLIREVLRQKQDNLEAVVVAFQTSKRTLLTSRERYNLLKSMGVDRLIECPLDKKMMHMKAEDFIKEVLVKQLHGAKLVVGPDYRFGYQRRGDIKLLQDMEKDFGYQVTVLDKARDGSRVISSTYVREQLNEGNIEKANELLGYRFATTGKVLHGRGLGHTIGVPTTNLIPPKEKIMPPNGVYITRSYFKGREYQGITNVGYKPTVGGEAFLGVETYLFQCDEDLYGEQSTVEFYKFLRPERKFPSLEELKKQLSIDVKQGQEFFSKK